MIKKTLNSPKNYKEMRSIVMIKKRTFSGGYFFKNFTGHPQEKIDNCNIPSKVIIPLKQNFGNEVPSLVKSGDKVKAGQIIGRNDNSFSSPIHSSVSGIVEEVKKINYFKEVISSVFINSEGSQDWQPLKGHNSDWEKLSSEKIEELIYLSGVSKLDNQGIPTRFKSSLISPEEVENLIIHGVGSEIYNLSLPIFLERRRMLNFVEGVKILKKILPKAKLHLAFNKHQQNIIEEISKLLSGLKDIEIYSLEPKYPQGYDEILIPTILNEKFPYGYSAANIGVIILNIQVVLQVYEAVAEGKPLIERTVTLCGSGFKEPVHMKVRIGTPLEFIIQDRTVDNIDLRFIQNSLLTGVVLSDLKLPVNSNFSQIICLPEEKRSQSFAFINPGFKKDSYSNTFLSKFIKVKKILDTNVHGELRPCIFCNYCQEVCPVNLIPHLLFRYVEKEIINQSLMNLKIFNCIGCNLCSYVCPSKIPVAKYIKEGQGKLIDIGYDQTLCILPYFDLKGIEDYRGIKHL